MRAHSSKTVLVRAGFVASILLASAGAFAQSTVALTAQRVTATLPDGQIVPMWGYSCGAVSGTGVSCTGLNPAAPTGAWPPPLITAPSTQPLTTTLTNRLQP